MDSEKNGFTLIESLVGMAIASIGMLALVALADITYKSGKTAETKNDFNQVVSSLQLFFASKDACSESLRNYKLDPTELPLLPLESEDPAKYNRLQAVYLVHPKNGNRYPIVTLGPIKAGISVKELAFTHQAGPSGTIDGLNAYIINFRVTAERTQGLSYGVKELRQDYKLRIAVDSQNLIQKCLGQDSVDGIEQRTCQSLGGTYTENPERCVLSSLAVTNEISTWDKRSTLFDKDGHGIFTDGELLVNSSHSPGYAATIVGYRNESDPMDPLWDTRAGLRASVNPTTLDWFQPNHRAIGGTFSSVVAKDNPPTVNEPLHYNYGVIASAGIHEQAPNIAHIQKNVVLRLSPYSQKGTIDQSISLWIASEHLSGGSMAENYAIKADVGKSYFREFVGVNASSPSSFSEVLRVSGNAYVEGSLKVNNVVYSSDRRLKREVETLHDSLNAVERLRGVKYRWRSDGSVGHDRARARGSAPGFSHYRQGGNEGSSIYGINRVLNRGDQGASNRGSSRYHGTRNLS